MLYKIEISDSDCKGGGMDMVRSARGLIGWKKLPVEAPLTGPILPPKCVQNAPPGRSFF